MSGRIRAGRGWAPVLGLTLVAAAFSVVNPVLVIFVPLAYLLLGLAPRRSHLVALGLALAGLPLLGGAAGPIWYIERGWAYVLGAWFLMLVLLLPRWTFLARALASLGAAAATLAGVLFANRGGWRRLDSLVSSRIQESARQVASWWETGAPPQWAGEVSGAAYRVAELQVLLYPALVGLASVAGLGVAWWAFRRLSEREPLPLGRLREFRFRDELVWIFICGVGLLLLPLGEAASRAGSNVVLFMGALYALRGAAVLLALLGAPGVLGTVFSVLAALLLYPLVMSAALVVGLSDTWVDFRRRRRPAEPS